MLFAEDKESIHNYYILIDIIGKYIDFLLPFMGVVMIPENNMQDCPVEQ